ncbi:MAG: sulfurtransferase-like selenium metabolism protein YedF [Pseudomonadota bacterium]
MESKTYDARGQLCPRPLMVARQALKEHRPDEIFNLLIDNQISKENVERFLADNHISFKTQQEGSTYRLEIKKGNQEITAGPTSTPLSTVICIKSNQMGQGPEELGKILIQAFINTLSDTDPFPQKIVFYNTGILLALDDSPVLPALNKLQDSGVKLLVCGTCVSYFNAKDKVKVGIISNMYDILEALSQSSKIIEP